MASNFDEHGCHIANDKEFYFQCSLSRRRDDGTIIVQVAWIPAKFAEAGRVLKIKATDGSWVDGWTVTSVGAGMVGVPDVRKGRRQHRKQTGDSLPKERK